MVLLLQDILRFNASIGVVFYHNTQKVSGFYPIKAFEFVASFFGLWTDAGRGASCTEGFTLVCLFLEDSLVVGIELRFV